MAEFVAQSNSLFKDRHMFAVVRKQEQAEALSGRGVEVLQLDLENEKDVIEAVLRHDGISLAPSSECLWNL